MKQLIVSEFNVNEIKIFEITPISSYFNDGYGKIQNQYFVLIKSDCGIDCWYGPILKYAAILILSFRKHIEKKPFSCFYKELENIFVSKYFRHFQTGLGRIALSVIDIMFHDIISQALNIPFHKLLSPTNYEPVKIQVLKSMLAFKEFNDSNFSKFMKHSNIDYYGQKWSLSINRRNRNVHISEIVKWVTRLGEHLNNKQILIFDIHNNWDNKILEKFETELYGNYSNIYLEEPIKLSDLKTYDGKLKFVYGEHLYSFNEFSLLKNNPYISIYNPDFSWCGILESVRIVNLFNDEKNIKLIPHGAGLLVNLHFAIAFNDKIPCVEYNEALENRRQILYMQTLYPVKGFFTKPSNSGLGIKINTNKIKKIIELNSLY